MRVRAFNITAALLLLAATCGPASPSDPEELSTSPASPTSTKPPTQPPTLLPTVTLTSTPSPTPTSTPRPVPEGAFLLNKEFAGIEDPSCGGGPDATIAAGQEVLVLAMNCVAGIMDKDGNIIDVGPMEDFFAPLRGQGVGTGTDPRVIFDPDSERFFFVKADYPDVECDPPCRGLIALAVSKTDNPKSLSSSDWHYYAFNRSIQKTSSGTRVTEYFGDFDNISTTRDALGISWDLDSEGGWLGPGGQARFIPKEPLLQGTQPEDWQDVMGLSGHVAVNLAETDRFFVVNSIPGEFRLWAVDDALASPQITTQRPIWLSGSLNDPPDAAQRQGPAIDLLQAKTPGIYAEGRLWIADVFRTDFGSGAVSAIHWMEIDVTNWPSTEVVQRGTLGEDGVWYFAPATMVDAQGNFAMIYVTSSEEDFISVHYTGRLASDPPGELRPSNVLVSGDEPYSRIQHERNRFLDYMGTALDPVDGTVWMMALYPTGGSTSGSWVGNMSWEISGQQ